MNKASYRPTILIADDKPFNIDILDRILQRDYLVKAVLNGSEVLEVTSQHPQPDLILLDIMMPDMDGFEVIRRLKACQETEQIPVIFVTGKQNIVDEERGLVLGAVDYVTKPISPSIVLARIKTHLALHQQKADLARKVVERSRELAIQTRRMKTVVKHSTDSVWCVQLRPPVDISLPLKIQTQTIYENGYFVEANNEAVLRSGVTPPEGPADKPISEVFDFHQISAVIEKMILEDYSFWNMEIDNPRKTEAGTNSLDVQGVIDDGKLTHYWAFARDITKKKKIEMQAQRLQSLLERSSDDVWCLEIRPPVEVSMPLKKQIESIFQNAYFVESNNVTASRSGTTDGEALIGRSLQSLRGSEQVKVLISKLIEDNYRIHDFEFSMETGKRSGPVIFSYDLQGIKEEGKLTYIWGVGRDITERKKQEENSLRTERLEAVRGLARQIVHDANNKISAILGNAELIQIDKNDPKLVEENAAYLITATQALTALLNELGQFSNTGQSEKTRSKVFLHELLNIAASDARSLLRQFPNRAIQIVLDADPSVHLWGNSPELSDVLLNLVKNSIEAMPDGGTIKLQCGMRDDQPYLSVSDTGLGMTKETRKKLFDLYFSTKGDDRGIGMSSVLGKMESYDGEITLESAEGKGTKFTLCFPAFVETPPF